MQTHNSLLLGRVTSLLIGGSALWTCLVESVAGQTPPAKPTAASPAETGPGRASSKPSETSKDAPEKSGADSESARKVRERLQTQFSKQDPKEMAETARALGNEAKAKFQFGRLIAVWRAREVRMTEQRLELRKQAEQKTQQRAQVRAQLDKEIEQTQQQFKADKVQCERQLTELIQSYLPQLQQLKDEAARATELEAGEGQGRDHAAEASGQAAHDRASGSADTSTAERGSGIHRGSSAGAAPERGRDADHAIQWNQRADASAGAAAQAEGGRT